MGYQTEFEGQIDIQPPLNEHEIAYLRAFADTRRMHRALGPYFADEDGFMGQTHREDVIDFNEPGPEQPGLWCKWVPVPILDHNRDEDYDSKDEREPGVALAWNGYEKFYDSVEWMRYLIDTFLKPGATLQEELLLMNQVPGRFYPAEFQEFTFDHVLNGTIHAEGEEEGDVWDLVVEDNEVREVARG